MLIGRAQYWKTEELFRRAKNVFQDSAKNIQSHKRAYPRQAVNEMVYSMRNSIFSLEKTLTHVHNIIVKSNRYITNTLYYTDTLYKNSHNYCCAMLKYNQQ